MNNKANELLNAAWKRSARLYTFLSGIATAFGNTNNEETKNTLNILAQQEWKNEVILFKIVDYDKETTTSKRGS